MRLVHLPAGHAAEAFVVAVVPVLTTVPAPARLSLTGDQGSEMARHDLLAPQFSDGVYFVARHAQTGQLYTDSGESHDDKGLKRRPVGDKRVVPIPPELVRILTAHLEEFGTAEDGRRFATSTGGTISASAVWCIWHAARLIGLSPEQQATPLAGRPYDLRHACATLLLNAGVPPKEVARRLGHSVEVLWKVYAGCLDGDEERINRMIDVAPRQVRTTEILIRGRGKARGTRPVINT